MDANEVPRLRLVLDYAAKNHDAVNTITVWNPNDDLCGHLELSSAKDLAIEKVTMYFEGVSRTWIAEEPALDPKAFTGERKFLSQAQDILSSNMAHRDSEPGQFVFEAYFHFIISNVVANPDPESPEQCLRLPPSLELGDVFLDESTGKRFAEPSITYYLRATAKINMGGDDGIKSLEASLPVIVMPHTEELPPTETNDFPLEFKEQDSKILRRFLVGSTLGTMKVSMQEPPPLSYEVWSVSSITDASIKLEFESTNSADTQKSLQGLSFTVYSLVRVKTFYSVKSFPRLPSQSLLDDCNETKLRDGIIKLKTRVVRNVLWGYRYDLEDQATVATPNPTAQMNPSCDTSISTGSGQSNTHASSSCVPNGKWISNWNIPIEIDGLLLPTFCSSLVARFYSLIIRVKVVGIRQESFDLEVPLQVLHTSPGQAQSAMGEPIQEPLLEFQRMSETSRFSDESLVSGEDLPGYYP